MQWLRRLWNTFRQARMQRDIDRELSFHIAERVDQLRGEGIPNREAARLARLQFGNPVAQAERTRDVDVARYADAFGRNVRYATRTLVRTPGFTLTVVLLLALGIGANTAVFSAVDAVLLQPLPFPDGDRLVRVLQNQARTTETNVAPVRLEEWNDRNGTFEALTGYYTEDVSEASADLPERLRRAMVAPRFAEVLGIAPALGRAFTDAEHRPGAPRAVLISDRYWRRRFAADPNVLGKTVRAGGTSSPIVGVMPPSFQFPDRDVDLWFPRLNDQFAQSRQAVWYTGIGRLKPRVTLEQARADLALIQAQLAEQYPNTDRDISAVIVPLKETMVGNVRGSLLLLFAAVSVLLLITCTNVAALLLSRAARRRREISVRLSLGASRAAVAAQLLTEAGVLALAGSVLGLGVAGIGARAFRWLANDLPRVQEIAIDGRILLYVLASTLAVVLICGLLPAIRIAREGMAATHELGRTQVSTRNSLQWLLVGAQVALSVTLLAAAGLLVRSLHELSRVDPGFEPSRVLSFRVSGNYAEFGDYPRLLQRIDTALEELRALPGVEAAATSFSLPGVPTDFEVTFDVVEARANAESNIVAESRVVSPEYFETLRIPLLDGEPCRRQPRGSGEVMVNEAFASRYVAGRPAAGLHLLNRATTSAENNRPTPPVRIAGVVGNARERGLDREPGPTVYFCSSAQSPTPYFLVRTHGEPSAIAQVARLKIKELEPLRAVYEVSTLEAQIGGAFAQNRLRTVLLVLFAVTALSLACLGLYGTVSYVVSLRRREAGLRLALGARRTDIVRQFLGQGIRIAGLGSLSGLALSVAFTRAMSGMLYGVSPSDPATLSTALAIVLAVSALAALIPATRAALVEPMRVLREE